MAEKKDPIRSLIEAGRRPADNVHMPQRDGVKAP